MTKEGWIRNTILFGKYRLLRKLGTGRTGTVWLAEHIGLEEYRAIKRISRSDADYDTFQREALVLKELRHPGIPMIYDLEEDSEFFYLIEEYLEGYSLYALIASQGPIQEAEAARYGMQVCGLVAYMHSACEIPILHLDLQPNNLIICNGTVKLIDFDHAAGSRRANIASKRFGTVGCAAPEQYASDRLLDQRTDIYAIGAVLRFMTAGTLREGTGQPAGRSDAFERIIRTCMEPNMEKRYASAKEVETALRALCTRELTVEKKHKAIPSHILILTGMKAGTGTTHLALGLVHFLNRHGYRALYEEHNDSQAVAAMAGRTGMRPDCFGIYAMNGCFLRPRYGPCVKLDEGTGFDVIVKDYGTDWQQAELELKASKADLLGTGSAGIWEGPYIRHYITWMNRVWAGRCGGNRGFIMRGTRTVCQKELRAAAKSDRALKGIKLFVSPDYGNPFRQKREEEAFFQSLWSAVTGSGREQGGARGWLERWDFLKEIFLNTAANLQKGAGSSESQEQDGEPG